MLGFELGEPGGLLRTSEPGVCVRRQRQEVLGVPKTGRVGLAAGFELLQAKLADGLEHRVARLAEQLDWWIRL